MENSVFTKGSVKDADAILELIKKRIEWMDENNIEQWNKTDYLSFYPKEYFEEKAEAGQLYIMKNVSPAGLSAQLFCSKKMSAGETTAQTAVISTTW